MPKAAGSSSTLMVRETSGTGIWSREKMKSIAVIMLLSLYVEERTIRDHAVRPRVVPQGKQV